MDQPNRTENLRATAEACWNLAGCEPRGPTGRRKAGADVTRYLAEVFGGCSPPTLELRALAALCLHLADTEDTDRAGMDKAIDEIAKVLAEYREQRKRPTP